jgi:hypothetical protein
MSNALDLSDPSYSRGNLTGFTPIENSLGGKAAVTRNYPLSLAPEDDSRPPPLKLCALSLSGAFERVSKRTGLSFRETDFCRQRQTRQNLV